METWAVCRKWTCRRRMISRSAFSQSSTGAHCGRKRTYGDRVARSAHVRMMTCLSRHHATLRSQLVPQSSQAIYKTPLESGTMRDESTPSVMGYGNCVESGEPRGKTQLDGQTRIDAGPLTGGARKMGFGGQERQGGSSGSGHEGEEERTGSVG